MKWLVLLIIIQLLHITSYCQNNIPYDCKYITYEEKTGKYIPSYRDWRFSKCTYYPDGNKFTTKTKIKSKENLSEYVRVRDFYEGKVDAPCCIITDTLYTKEVLYNDSSGYEPTTYCYYKKMKLFTVYNLNYQSVNDSIISASVCVQCKKECNNNFIDTNQVCKVGVKEFNKTYPLYSCNAYFRAYDDSSGYALVELLGKKNMSTLYVTAVTFENGVIYSSSIVVYNQAGQVVATASDEFAINTLKAGIYFAKTAEGSISFVVK